MKPKTPFLKPAAWARKSKWLLGFAVFALIGCGAPKREETKTTDSAKHAQETPRFQTSWQDESQFIVESIVTDVAEMAVFAKSQKLPDSDFALKATEKTNSPTGALIYVLEITIEKSKPPIKMDLTIDGPIWSPNVYAGVVKAIFESVGLDTSSTIATKPDDKALLMRLTELTPRRIQEENVAISGALEKDFKNPKLHENAALLLGAFMLRDSSRDFFDIRAPLCRMSAHLAFAQGLTRKAGPSLIANIAETLLLTLINNEKDALEKTVVWQAQPDMSPWARALRTRNTHDYRILAGMKQLTILEKLELFRAQCHSGDPTTAWDRLAAEDKLSGTDYIRIAQAYSFSVGTGHELLAASIPFELKEASDVYLLASGKKLTQGKAVDALNVPPERAMVSRNQPKVEVIGWGQWANFIQRHLCHSLQHNYIFLHDRFGAPDSAKEFVRSMDAQFGGLRLYPFFRRLTCHEPVEYRRAIDDGFALTVKTPHLVPIQVWTSLYAMVKFAPLYQPNVNPQIERWLKRSFPYGTAYDPSARLSHPRQQQYADLPQRAEALYRSAPYDPAIVLSFIQIKYRGGQTVAQSRELLRPILEFDAEQNARLAQKAANQPQQYEELMLQAAQINPEKYFRLGTYFAARHDDEKAAAYYEKAMQLGSDSVLAANNADWLVKYYQRKGMTNKAVALAEGAANVYSAKGLQTKADLMESLGKYEEALELYHNLEERYGPYPELMGFLIRYKAKMGVTRHDVEIEYRLKKLFPNGIEKVTSKDFPPGQPKDGVWLQQQNELTKSVKLEPGDIIVAVFGIRVHNFFQYTYARETIRTPEMNLIVWRRGQYSELTVNLPGRRFGVPMKTFSTVAAAQ